MFLLFVVCRGLFLVVSHVMVIACVVGLCSVSLYDLCVVVCAYCMLCLIGVFVVCLLLVACCLYWVACCALFVVCCLCYLLCFVC